METLTSNEKYIFEVLRTLNPFERVEILASKDGKVNNFIVIRSKKVLLTDDGPIQSV